MNHSRFSTSRSLPGKRGFTLIELLVVIAIIGILSAIILASLNTAQRGEMRLERLLSTISKWRLNSITA